MMLKNLCSSYSMNISVFCTCLQQGGQDRNSGSRRDSVPAMYEISKRATQTLKVRLELLSAIINFLSLNVLHYPISYCHLKECAPYDVFMLGKFRTQSHGIQGVRGPLRQIETSKRKMARKVEQNIALARNLSQCHFAHQESNSN